MLVAAVGASNTITDNTREKSSAIRGIQFTTDRDSIVLLKYKRNNPHARAFSPRRVSNPSIRENLLCCWLQEMTRYPSSLSILFLLRPALSASVIPRRVITGERVAKDQSATNDAYAAPGNPKVNEKTMQRTVHAGVDRKAAAYA